LIQRNFPNSLSIIDIIKNIDLLHSFDNVKDKEKTAKVVYLVCI